MWVRATTTAAVTKSDGSGRSRKLAEVWWAGGKSDVASCATSSDCAVKIQCRITPRLVESAPRGHRDKPLLLMATDPRIADGDERLPQQHLGEPGVERGEQRRPRGFVWMQASQPVRSDLDRRLVPPSDAPNVNGNAERWAIAWAPE